MLGIELVQDKSTKEPLNPEKVMAIWELTKDMGLLIGCYGGLTGNVIMIKPPMCITKEDVDFTVEVLDQAMKLAMK